jgi:hypothetical protein
MGKKKDKKAAKKAAEIKSEVTRSVQVEYYEVKSDEAPEIVTEGLDVLDELIQRGFTDANVSFEPYDTNQGRYVDVGYNAEKKCWRLRGKDQMVDDSKVEEIVVGFLQGTYEYNYNTGKVQKKRGY